MISSAFVPISDGDSKYLQEDPSSFAPEDHPSIMTYSNFAPSSRFTDDFIHLDFEKLALESPPDGHFPAHALPVSRDGFSLDEPFTLVNTKPRTTLDNDEGTIIDTFAPRPSPFNLSPTSSTDSDLDGPLGTLAFDAFLATRSRVVRLLNLPFHAASLLKALLCNSTVKPLSVWTLREGYAGQRPREEGIWAVFRTHEEARVALSLSGPSMSVVSALETDLEPFHKLRRFSFENTVPQIPAFTHISSPPTGNLPMIRMSQPSECQTAISNVRSSFERSDYPISSNPPNPRTSFRLGDWICSSPNCAAHNFGRNLSCIGCGCPRSGHGGTSPRYQASSASTRLLSSPRFVTSSGFQPPFGQSLTPPPSSSVPFPVPSYPPQFPPPSAISKAHPHALPLLSPSGRAFAVGGKVQNISSDPLAPCIVYWPDNEPLPSQGQIRPSTLAGIPQPPILNTGNRGPIEHQPGDWVCLKCNYLNWRRRKVCQTCYPYAEGNGDSISSAVQAERIALLTSVLAQSQALSQANPPQSQPQHRSYSLTPPQVPRPPADFHNSRISQSVHRSRSHFDLSHHHSHSQPIYQTSGRHGSSSPPEGSTTSLHLHAPAPLLPSFLQDIVQSPTLSPTSSSSADLSLDEPEENLTLQIGAVPRSRPLSGTRESPSSMALRNIWKMDGEETKNLSTLGSPNRENIQIGSKKGSQEMIHPPSTIARFPQAVG